jgi:superfamily II DNA or RNA helicase
MELREHQHDAIAMIYKSIMGGHKHPILCAVTAFGKTIVGAEILRRSIGKGKNVLWLADRKELIWQAIQRFNDFGIGEKVGVIMAGEQSDLSRPVQVASVATYIRRLKLEDLEFNKWYHNADLICYDECHLSLSKTRRKLLQLYDDKYIIGFSATPGRSDKCAMGEIYDDIVMASGIQELTDMNYLVPVRYYGSPLQPDMRGVPIVMGEYDKKETGKRVNKPELVGDILTNWLRIAESRQTIIFAQNRSHSKHIRTVFENKGINIAHIDAYTPRELRQEVLERLNDGSINVVTNCNCYTEGVDVPAASVCVIAKPVKFVGRYLQMGGRILRPYPGKTEGVIIDHAGCVGPPTGHGYLDDPIEWVLHGKEIIAKKKQLKKERILITCDRCCGINELTGEEIKAAVIRGGICERCGHTIPDLGKKVECIQADLVPIGKKNEKEPKMNTAEKRRWYGMFAYEQRRLGKNEKWLLAQYKSKTGVWPRNMEDVAPIEPTQDVKNWLTYQRIKWVKSKKRQESQCG